MVNGNSSAFNALNPFVTEEPGYYSEIFNGNISGPLGKKASFFFTAQQRNIDNVAWWSAQMLDPSNDIVPYNTTVPSPSTRLNISPRVDFQLTPDNTLTVRYQYERNTQNNDGIGQFSLPTVGFQLAQQRTDGADQRHPGHQPDHRERDTLPVHPRQQQPASAQHRSDADRAGRVHRRRQPIRHRDFSNQDHYELQNYTSIAHGKHFIKFGGRLARHAVLQQRELGFQRQLTTFRR